MGDFRPCQVGSRYQLLQESNQELVLECASCTLPGLHFEFVCYGYPRGLNVCLGHSLIHLLPPSQAFWDPMCTADSKAQWGRDRPEVQSPWSSVGHQSSVYPTHFLPHCRLQEPAEAMRRKNTATWGRVSVATEDMCEGMTPFPARLGRASGLVGNSRHWAFWLAIYMPLEMLHVIGVPVSQVQGQGPPNFIMRHESIYGIPGSSFIRAEALWEKNRVCPTAWSPQECSLGPNCTKGLLSL